MSWISLGRRAAALPFMVAGIFFVGVAQILMSCARHIGDIR